MKCPECTARVPEAEPRCPECGVTLATGGERESQSRGGLESERATESSEALDRQSPQSDDEGQQNEEAQPRSRTGRGHQTNRGSGHGGQRPQGDQQEPTQGGQPGRPSGPARGPPSGSRYGTQGPNLLAQAKTALSRLPWWAGTTAGGLITLFGIGICWAALATIEVPRAGEAAVYLFTSLLEFTPPSEVARRFVTAGYLSADTFGSNILGGQFDALLGACYLFVPWLFYKSGREFASRHAKGSESVIEYVGVGATVIGGTIPVIGVTSLVFGGDVVNDVFIAGLLVPGGLGAVGGLGIWTFREYDRTPSWGGGFTAGLIGLLLTGGLTFIWASVNVGPGDAIAAWVLAILATFVGVVTGGFSAGTMGLLAYASVTLPVFAFGYFRARRGQVTITDPIEGARAGATLIAGFSTLLFLVLTGYTVLLMGLVTEGQALFQANPAYFLPSGVGGQNIPRLITLWNYLQAYVVGGILFPMMVGTIGGAVGGYLEGQAVRQEGSRHGTQHPRRN